MITVCTTLVLDHTMHVYRYRINLMRALGHRAELTQLGYDHWFLPHVPPMACWFCLLRPADLKIIQDVSHAKSQQSLCTLLAQIIHK